MFVKIIILFIFGVERNISFLCSNIPIHLLMVFIIRSGLIRFRGFLFLSNRIHDVRIFVTIGSSDVLTTISIRVDDASSKLVHVAVQVTEWRGTLGQHLVMEILLAEYFVGCFNCGLRSVTHLPDFQLADHVCGWPGPGHSDNE